MVEDTDASRAPRSTDPDVRTQPARHSVFTPWGYIQCGSVVLAAGALLFLASSRDSYSDVDPLIGQVIGVVVGVLGLLFAVIGVVAEGVRVGMLHARRHDGG